jgi:hypothetical protein
MELEREIPPGIERHVIDGKVKYLPKVPEDEAEFTARDAFKILREWNQDGTVQWMKRLTVNLLAPRLAWWLSLMVIGLHGWWACKSSCGVNFARGGALIVLLSAIGLGVVAWYEPNYGLLSGGKIKRWHFFHPLVMLPALGIIGTVLWGYGDLLPIFGNAC